MIEIFLLFCFIAILSALVGLIRGVAMIVGIMWNNLRDNKLWRNQ